MDRDNFMSPQEALEFGLIDKVLDHPPLLGENDKAENPPVES